MEEQYLRDIQKRGIQKKDMRGIYRRKIYKIYIREEHAKERNKEKRFIMRYMKKYKGTNEQGTYRVTYKEEKLDKKYIQIKNLYNYKIYKDRDIYSKKTL